MKSTWNRTCFPNPPWCCMYRLPYEQVGPDIKGSRWVAFLLSVSWNWHLHTALGTHTLVLFISHSRRDRYRQCLCLEQSKIRQTSSGRVVNSFPYFDLDFQNLLISYSSPILKGHKRVNFEHNYFCFLSNYRLEPFSHVNFYICPSVNVLEARVNSWERGCPAL